MKQLLFFYILLLTPFISLSQYAGNANDWVEYDKTYYRYSISEDGIYRLTKADLLSAGINESDLVGSHFKLIRNGEELPLFVSTNGTFTEDDYIEFFGRKNDGRADTGLYPSPLQQPGVSQSLFSDESIHFLTIDASSTNKRITTLANDLTNLPSKENYFMAEINETSGSYYAGKYTRYGFSTAVNLYDSTYDNCEGYNFRLNTNGIKQFDFEADEVYTTANVDATVEFKIASVLVNNSNQPGQIEVSLGSSSIETKAISGTFAYTSFTETYSPQEIGNSKLRIKNLTPVRLYIPEKKLIYPRTFNFSGKNFSYVNLSKNGSRYIEFENLPTSSTLVVYDLSSNQRITESTQTITKIRTGSTSSQNNLVFDTDITTPTFTHSVNFENFVNTNNLVVIYPETLKEPINGENYVQKFIDHKSSSVGGNWNVTKASINQIIDQFAYGIKMHPAAIKNLTAELKANNSLPEHIILIGKGYEYQLSFDNSFEDNFIPTYGSPGSDSQLVADYGEYNQNCGIGRIAARNTTELQAYVDKVIEYQTLMSQTDDIHQTKDKLWMKKAMHLGGGANASEQTNFRAILNGFKTKFEKPQFGGSVTSFFKNTTDPIQTVDLPEIDLLINEGLSIINYFGHSAVNRLEFNINDFSQYDHEGKYPFMLTNGCYVGDVFQQQRSLSEDFVLIDNAGTLSFMGPSQFGIANGMSAFISLFYDYFVTNDYGIPIGEAIMLSHQNITANSQLIRRLTKQQMIFHGDPTLSIYSHEKTDYLVTEEDVSFEPNVLTTDIEEFDVNVVISNIGKAKDEPVDVTITRILPNGDEEEFTQSLDHVYFQDTITFTFNTNPLIAEGVNQFMVKIDKNDQLDEITRANNNLIAPVSRPIINDAVKPILPNEFGITNNTNIELIAYTSRFTAEPQTFEMQIDTTELFNSPFLSSGSISSNGGTIKWKPNVSYENERVYYWRVRKQDDDAEWKSSSFVFLQDYEEGWNQSHYYQFLKDHYNKFNLNENRLYEFATNNREVNVRTAPYIIPFNQISYSIDGYVQSTMRCAGNIAIAVMDKNTGIPWENESVGGGLGLYNSIFCAPSTKMFFYNTNTPEDRAKVIAMLNQIDAGNYVLAFSLFSFKPQENNWAAENDLRQTFQENGAQNAFSIVDNAPYAFFFQKGNPDFEHTRDIAAPSSDSILDENFVMPVKFGEGSLTSTLIGPAASWNTFIWDWDNSLDNLPEGDKISYTIIGVNEDEIETTIATGLQDPTYDLSDINANNYPYLKIKVNFEDRIHFTPAQLNKVRIVYEALPEMAIDITNIAQLGELNLSQHEPMTIQYKLDNIYIKDMSEVLVKYTYNQAAGGQSSEEERYNALPAGQSQSITYDLNTVSANLIGESLLYIDANPNNDQPEQYHFNNIALIQFTINKDNQNPYLDVTFDGIHIIDGDLVADTPEILISLTDENDYLLLNNPDDFEIIVTAPNGQETTYTVASPEITFYPANNTTENSAKIEFKPQFQPGTYQMRVQATDRSNNQAGENDYLITFEVTNEDIITQIINYPNPFTTSTQFIAKIVGDAPDEVMIQIFSQSGHVIRELHSYAADISLSQGNNFYSVATWDGTDEYGDPIGNGVYYYKISMKRNGELIESHDSDKYSEYFHNGIGKLYILR